MMLLYKYQYLIEIQDKIQDISILKNITEFHGIDSVNPVSVQSLTILWKFKSSPGPGKFDEETQTFLEDSMKIY